MGSTAGEQIFEELQNATIIALWFPLCLMVSQVIAKAGKILDAFIDKVWARTVAGVQELWSDHGPRPIAP